MTTTSGALHGAIVEIGIPYSEASTLEVVVWGSTPCPWTFAECLSPYCYAAVNKRLLWPQNLLKKTPAFTEMWDL